MAKQINNWDGPFFILPMPLNQPEDVCVLIITEISSKGAKI